jgi:hypothetical protein
MPLALPGHLGRPQHLERQLEIPTTLQEMRNDERAR